MESRSFPSSFDIAGRYAKHRKQFMLRRTGVGKDMNYGLYPPTAAQYEANSKLDKNNDGSISKQEAYNAVKNKLEKQLKNK